MDFLLVCYLHENLMVPICFAVYLVFCAALWKSHKETLVSNIVFICSLLLTSTLLFLFAYCSSVLRNPYVELIAFAVVFLASALLFTFFQVRKKIVKDLIKNLTAEENIQMSKIAS